MRLASFALFITWTTYGTWLPGDRRGYVSRTLLADGVFQPKRNQSGSPITPGNAQTLATAQKAQKYDTVWLDRKQALIAAQAIRQAALERRWVIIRASVMANHIHTLTTACPDDGPGVRRVLKGVSSAELSKAAGRPHRWWTQGGSDRYLHDPAAIGAAERYIRNQRGILCEIVAMQVIPRK